MFAVYMIQLASGIAKKTGLAKRILDSEQVGEVIFVEVCSLQKLEVLEDKLKNQVRVCRFPNHRFLPDIGA